MPSSLDELVRAWRGRAAEEQQFERAEFEKGEKEPFWDRADAHYKAAEIHSERGGIWARAAQELAAALKGQDAPKQNPRP